MRLRVHSEARSSPSSYYPTQPASQASPRIIRAHYRYYAFFRVLQPASVWGRAREVSIVAAATHPQCRRRPFVESVLVALYANTGALLVAGAGVFVANKIVSGPDLKILARLLVKILFPLFTFSNFRIYSVDKIAAWYVASICSILFMAIGALMGWLAGCLFGLRAPYSKMLVLSTTFGNVGALPYVLIPPIVSNWQLVSSQREENLLKGFAIIAFCWSLGVGALQRRSALRSLDGAEAASGGGGRDRRDGRARAALTALHGGRVHRWHRAGDPRLDDWHHHRMHRAPEGVARRERTAALHRCLFVPPWLVGHTSLDHGTRRLARSRRQVATCKSTHGPSGEEEGGDVGIGGGGTIRRGRRGKRRAGAGSSSSDEGGDGGRSFIDDDGDGDAWRHHGLRRSPA